MFIYNDMTHGDGESPSDGDEETLSDAEGETLPDGGTTADISEEELHAVVRSAVIDAQVSLLNALVLGVLAVAFFMLGTLILLEASDPFGLVFFLLGAVVAWFGRRQLD
jgi:hypothetical protein